MFSWKVGILLLGFLFLAPPLASSKTWIVDDDGGPGVDFTDIQPAIDAAAPGDLIVVRNGDYNGFILFKDLILAAVNEAQRKAEEMMRTEMEKATGGMNMPPREINSHWAKFTIPVAL